MKNVPDCNIGKIHIFFIFTSVVKMSWTHEEQPSESAVNLTTVMTNIVVDESTDHATPLLPKYYSLFYFFKNASFSNNFCFIFGDCTLYLTGLFVF